MSRLNLLVSLNAFQDSLSSNNPARNLVKWTRELTGFPVQDNANGEGLYLAPGETKTLFNGIVSLTQDGSAVYNLSLKVGTPSTYVLQLASGTAPNFRTNRALTGLDNTSRADIAQNGPVSTLTISAGSTTNFSTDGIVPGDRIRLGAAFLVDNQGEFKVLAVSSSSVQFENIGGVAQTAVNLTSTPKVNLRAYSAAGVQIGNTLLISGGFSPASFGSYVITNVADDYVEFSSAHALPVESAIHTDAFVIYTKAKNVIYVESNQNASLTVNSGSVNIEPFVDPTNVVTPGIFLIKTTVYSLSITNTSEDTTTVFFASAE